MNTLLLGYNEQMNRAYEPLIANTLFLGGTGCGKTRFIVENIKHQKNANMIILDVNDVLFNETHDTLTENGYAVTKYNPTVDSDFEMDLAMFFAKEKMVLFIEAEVISAISSPAYTTLLKRSISRAVNTKTENDIIFVLSEASAIRDLSEMIASAKVHNIAFILEAQDVQQLSDSVLQDMSYIVFVGKASSCATVTFLNNYASMKTDELCLPDDECIAFISRAHIRLKKLPVSK